MVSDLGFLSRKEDAGKFELKEFMLDGQVQEDSVVIGWPGKANGYSNADDCLQAPLIDHRGTDS